MKSMILISAMVLASGPSWAKDKTWVERDVASVGQTIVCGDFKIGPIGKMGDLPNVDTSYPSKVTEFSFRDENLLLVAMDVSDHTRVRLVISAQYNRRAKTYSGQLMRDDGGNELQLDNGPIHCTVK